MLLITACSTDLDQVPPNLADADALENYEGVLNAAYGYHFDAVAPMAIFGDFRSDNCAFDETPFTDFDEFPASSNLASSMTSDFFRPFYAALYNSILSANGVIEKSTDPMHIGEAQFLRALSYFKLVQVFGDVTVNLLAEPTVDEIADADLSRKPKAEVFELIITDLENAMSALSTTASGGRATSIAAEALLGKVYATMGRYGDAETTLGNVVNGASAAGISLDSLFTDVFKDGSKEVLFATQISSTASISNHGGETFTNWYRGSNTKADENAPLTSELIDAFFASTGDQRTGATVTDSTTTSTKYAGGDNQDWIEIRLADVILLYAEALNENGNSGAAVIELDKIRTRAGLAGSTASSQAEVKQAILDERRLELACEGHRWFDLVRTGTVDAEMGQAIDPNYYVFPIPTTEVTSFDAIVQNPGY